MRQAKGLLLISAACCLDPEDPGARSEAQLLQAQHFAASPAGPVGVQGRRKLD